ncbi:MAG: IS66 family transposase [Cellulosilyticaceae bacterium]
MTNLKNVSKDKLIQEYIASKSVIDSLSSTNDELRDQTDQLNNEIKKLESKLESAQNELLILYTQIAASRLKKYGKSSESHSLNQLNLFEVEETEVVAEITNSPTGMDDSIEPTPNKKGVKYKRGDFSKLDVEEEDLDLSELEKKEYGSELTFIGKEIVERLRYRPAKFWLQRFNIYKYKLENDDGTVSEIISKNAPSPLIERSKVSSELVSHIIHEKVCMGTPLYRQEKNFKAMDVPFSRQNLCTWTMKATELYLQPLVKMMAEDMRNLDVLHMDETTLKVVEKKSKGYIWLVMSGKHEKSKMSLYFYKDNRNHAHASDILGDFGGYLHTDGYQAYPKIDSVTNVGCFAHARRYLNDALELDEGYKGYKEIKDKQTMTDYLNQRVQLKHKVEAISLIGQLFKYEREYESLSSQERYVKRQEYSSVVVDKFFDFMRALSSQYAPKTKMGKAIQYALNQETQLRNYLLDGRLEISNNQAERLIKPFVIGRKNFLFSSSTNGAHTTALNYSVLESAKLNGLKPQAYLTYVFDQMTGKKLTDELIRSLLPYSDKLPEHLFIKNS